ncbi:MAG: hypothetical protein Q9222_000874 [Ikaeria aurantiellina]
MSEQPLNVVIVGGSLTGLFQGIALKRLGHNVRILERASPENLREQGAGIGMRPETLEFFGKYDQFPDQPYFIPGEGNIQFFDKGANVSKAWKMQVGMSSWDMLYYRLRTNFDGLRSGYVDMGNGQIKSGDGTAIYEYGCNVTSVKYEDGRVEVEYLIPGKNGSQQPGHRLLNYVWYCNYPADSAELKSIMTDIDGHRHRITMPPGKMRSEVYEAQKQYAEEILPEPFAEVVRKTTQPFAQCITEVEATGAVGFDVGFCPF